jgi:SSS family solute:Na+ symporter
MTNFFVAGRKMPWWLAGMSLAATNFASDSPMHMAAMTRRSGILGCWFYFRQITGKIVATIFFAKLWRRSKVVTDVEFYELRHGQTGAKVLRGILGVYFSLIISPLRISIFIIGMRKFCQVILNIPEQINIPLLGNISSSWTISLVLTFIALAYSAMSGLIGVAWTDLVEFIISMVGTYSLMFFGLSKIGGLSVLKEKVLNITTVSNPNFNPFAIFPNQSDFFSFTFLFYLVGFWVLIQGAGGARQAAQRFLASKSEKDATLCGFWNIIVTFMIRFWPWFIIGFISLILYPNLSDHELAAPLMTWCFVFGE